MDPEIEGLKMLAAFPEEEWVRMTDNDGKNLDFVTGDLPLARFMGLIESATSKDLTTIAHRLTAKGRRYVERHQ